MARRNRSRRRIRPVLAAVVAAGMLASLSATPAQAAPQWHEGQIVRTYVTSCLSIIQGTPRQVEGSWSWVGYWADANNLPKVGEVYYGHSVVGVVGDACSGHRVHVEMTPPPGSDLAISAQNPVRCWYTNPQGSRVQEAACPAQPQLGTQGAYAFPPNTQDGTWPLGVGWTLEIEYPLVSRKRLNGTAASPCDCLRGANRVLDGNSSPWVYPAQGTFVAENPPTITYPSPATTGIGNAAAHARGFLWAHYAKGTSYVDWGPTTAYGSSVSNAIDGSADGWQIDHDFTGLTPGTVYHWRLRFQREGGGTYLGADQTFTTTGTAPVSPGPGTDPGGGTPTTEPGTTPMIPVTGTTPTTTVPGTTLTTTTTPTTTTGSDGDTATRPVLGSLQLTPVRFRTGAGRGTKISYGMSEVAAVKFVVDRILSGRRSGSRCVAPTMRNRAAKPCKRYRRIPGSIDRGSTAGPNSFKFTGNVDRRTLAPGRYRLSGVATDAARNQSNVVRRGFKVVR